MGIISTKGRGPFELIYCEGCIDKQGAYSRERYSKSGMGKRYIRNRIKRFLSLTGLTKYSINFIITAIVNTYLE